MDPLLTGVAAAALTEGVKFLYQQAAEVLTSWRARRRDASQPPPEVLPAPAGLTVGAAAPLADAPSSEVLEALQELKDLVEPIKDGRIGVDEPAARQAVDDLRSVLETVLRAPISFAGEPARPSRVADVEVVTGDVAGRVIGVRKRLADITGVSVRTGAVVTGGEVIGVDDPLADRPS